MKRYSFTYRDANSDRSMVENSRGDWVKYKDVAEALNIVGRLAKQEKITTGIFRLDPLNDMITKAKIYRDEMENPDNVCTCPRYRVTGNHYPRKGDYYGMGFFYPCQTGKPRIKLCD